MRDLPRQDQFLFESSQDFRIRGHVSADHLQRYLAVQFAVMRLVDGPHAASPKQAYKFVPFS